MSSGNSSKSSFYLPGAVCFACQSGLPEMTRGGDKKPRSSVIRHPPQTSALPLSQEGFIIWTGISKRPLRGLLSANLISTYRRAKAVEDQGWGRKCAFLKSLHEWRHINISLGTAAWHDVQLCVGKGAVLKTVIHCAHNCLSCCCRWSRGFLHADCNILQQQVCGMFAEWLGCEERRCLCLFGLV